MREAQRLFRRSLEMGENSKAHIILASARLSLAERYNRWWQWPLAVWHRKLAVVHANRAAAFDRYLDAMTADELDTMSLAWRAPRWLGGDADRAAKAKDKAERRLLKIE